MSFSRIVTFFSFFFSRCLAGPAEELTPITFSKFAGTDQHESDDAFLQQPYDVLSAQRPATAGCKPKTHRQPVQPRGTAKVRTPKNDEKGCTAHAGPPLKDFIF